MKKFLLTLLALMLTLSIVLSFAGCGDKTKDDEDSTKKPASSQNGSSTENINNGNNNNNNNSNINNTTSSSNSIDSALNAYINVILNKATYKTLAPDDLWVKIIELIMEEEELSKTEAETYLNESMNEEFSYSYSDMVDEYGDNFKLSYKITSTEKYNGEDYDDILDYLTDETGLKRELIGEIGEFECELSIEGDKGSNTEKSEMGYFVYDGKYYLGIIIEAFF